MSRRPAFLLAVPAYREGKRLEKFLPGLVRMVVKTNPKSRVILVDDGSGPAQNALLRPLVRRLQNGFPRNFGFLALPKNRGKGGAILAAWKSSLTGFEYLGFVDADGAFDPAEVARVAAQLNHGSPQPALFASRVKMMGFSVKRSPVRHYLGRIFATWVGMVLESGVYDSQCGLKFIPSGAFARISPHLKGRGFSFDIELLGALLSAGCPIREIPVNWRDVPGSKVRFWRDGVGLFWNALREGWRIRKRERQRR